MAATNARPITRSHSQSLPVSSFSLLKARKGDDSPDLTAHEARLVGESSCQHSLADKSPLPTDESNAFRQGRGGRDSIGQVFLANRYLFRIPFLSASEKPTKGIPISTVFCRDGHHSLFRRVQSRQGKGMVGMELS